MEKAGHVRARLAVFAAVLMLLLLLYTVRPDWAQAAHWWPMVFCTPLVIAPFLSLKPRRLIQPLLLSMLLWCGALHFVREPSGLVFVRPAARDAQSFRVVSLNCAAGTLAAAKEAFAQSADLVLLEEVGGTEFIAVAKSAGYPYVSWSVDDAVFSRFPLSQPAKAMDFAAATVELGGKPIRFVALRLLPPVFRLDLWSLDCWRNYAEDAGQRRARVKALLAEAGASGVCLVGGDFNATNPRLITDNRPEWVEAGRSVGRGWRGTGTNDFPFVWVDQIWGSPDIRWVQAFAQETENSDHRMVVADFQL